MLVSLTDAGPEHGGKAAGLGRALRAGRQVPEGVVVPAGLPAAAVAASLPPWVDEVVVAVRSSASVEDDSDWSAAGIFDTVLDVRGRAGVAEAVETVRTSLHSARARAYRRPGPDPPREPEMHVIVQRQVRADIGGVLVTDGDRVVVEFSSGGPSAVVSGTSTPDRYVGGTAGADRLEAVVSLGQELAAAEGHEVDIEWALDGDRLWLLQVRPVTARLDLAALPGIAAAGTGVGASPGVATGPVRVVHGVTDFSRVRPGDVLVCRTTDPAWTPLLDVVAAVVTEVGGILSHAAIVARERGVPAVVGLEGARQQFHDGQLLTVDGTAGTAAPSR